jgi:hypothetical protein
MLAVARAMPFPPRFLSTRGQSSDACASMPPSTDDF